MSEWSKCKRCDAQNIVKNGKQNEVQRYKCKDCGAVFRGKDPKYSAEFKLDAIMMYINSMGIRAIARVKNVHNSVISVWIKQMGEVIKGVFHEKVNEITPKDISILELDELFTYVKKKRIRRMYLVLSTEIGSELLSNANKNLPLVATKTLPLILKKFYHFCKPNYALFPPPPPFNVLVLKLGPLILKTVA